MIAGTKVFIALFIALTTSYCASASDTTTKFQTGPFTGSYDLGMPCNDLNISEPVQGEMLSGAIYTAYVLNGGGVTISITKYDAPISTSNENFGFSVRSNLLDLGADKDTINVIDRKIDNKPGAVGYGYLPRYDSKLYDGGFYVSANSVAHIFIWGDETKMTSVIKTIHVTEAT